MFRFNRIARKLMALVIIFSILLVGSSCSSEAQTENSSVNEPLITMTYAAAFAGQAPSGYLNLVIDLTIENTGYESFDASASNFLVEVGEYSYTAKSGQIEVNTIPDGGKVAGKFTYEVPPQAALPKVGYKLIYSGTDQKNIQWIKTSLENTNTPVSQVSGPAINIGYSTRLMWLSAPGAQYLKVEPPGNLYLIVEMIIENKGYESFDTNPDNFSLGVSSPIRSVTAEVEEELIDWREINIQNNGKFTGTLAFHVPTEVAQSFYKWEYKMIYAGVRSYNINWNKINVSQLTLDMEETQLATISLADGKSIQGRIAYFITPEIATDSARYKMLYDLSTSHNVQWFNSPDASADINRNPLSYPVIKITYSTRIETQDESGQIRLMVDLSIENMGYESFITSPGHFLAEVSY